MSYLARLNKLEQQHLRMECVATAHRLELDPRDVWAETGQPLEVLKAEYEAIRGDR